MVTRAQNIILFLARLFASYVLRPIRAALAFYNYSDILDFIVAQYRRAKARISHKLPRRVEVTPKFVTKAMQDYPKVTTLVVIMGTLLVAAFPEPARRQVVIRSILAFAVVGLTLGCMFLYSTLCLIF